MPISPRLDYGYLGLYSCCRIASLHSCNSLCCDYNVANLITGRVSVISTASFISRERELFRGASRPSQLALGVGLLAVISGAVTYAILSGLIPWSPGPGGLIVLLLVNLTLGLSLGALIAWRLVLLWAEKKSGRAAARLHVRLVTWFSAIAVVPAILVAIFASVTLNLGLDAMFSGQVKGALTSAVNVAQVYAQEQQRNIIGDAYEIATEVQRDPTLFDTDKHIRMKEFLSQLNTLTKDRGLQASYIIGASGSALAQTKQAFLKDPKPPSAEDLAQARAGAIVEGGDPETSTVTALIQLQSLNDAYLEVVRVVDPQVFGYYRRTKSAFSEYNRLNQNRLEVQLVFAALYAVVSLVTLLAAVWSGIWAANRLVRPISSLMSAAERVSEGDLTAQVKVARER